MKLLVIAAVLGACAAGRLDNTYLPPTSGGYRAPGGGGFGGAGGFKSGSGFGGSGAGFGGSAGHGSSGFGGGSGHSGSGFGGAAGHSGSGFGGAAGHAGSGFGGGAGHSGSGFGGAAGQGGSGFGGAAGQAGSGFGGGFQTQHGGNIFNAGPAQYRQSAEAGAQILRQNSDVTAEGFSYDFETSNGIRADASGVATNGVQSRGSFEYKGDDGQNYAISYTADENGYQPQGAHLPTPPPIPEEILKSLEQNARDEAAGISDDGSYRGEGAGTGAGAGAYNRPSSQYGAPGFSGQGTGGFHGGSSGFQAGSSGFQAGSSGFQAGSSGFQAGSSGFRGGSSGFQKQTTFGGAASRQYLAPSTGPARGSGSGNFNTQSGYHY